MSTYPGFLRDLLLQIHISVLEKPDEQVGIVQEFQVVLYRGMQACILGALSRHSGLKNEVAYGKLPQISM